MHKHKTKISTRQGCELLSLSRNGLYYKPVKNKDGVPAVFNTDQGVQYTSDAWISILKQHDIMISMDGKGCWADNIWIERIWRTIKYEYSFGWN